jgi:hypothetical protein
LKAPNLDLFGAFFVLELEAMGQTFTSLPGIETLSVLFGKTLPPNAFLGGSTQTHAQL